MSNWIFFFFLKSWRSICSHWNQFVVRYKLRVSCSTMLGYCHCGGIFGL